jgi:hypothetical protein
VSLKRTQVRAIKGWGEAMSKQSWFLRGVQAFGDVAPAHRGQGYACPICLGISPSLATFTLEDVPPKCVGGRPLILTCDRCNGSAGTNLDWHWANFSDVEGFATGYLPEPVTVNFTYEGLRVVAELSNDGSCFVLAIVKRASNPQTVGEIDRLVRSAIEADGRPRPMHVNLHQSKFQERLVRLSVLRAGYLAGVAVAGYSMIPLWDRIRRQILDPTQTDESLSGLVRYEREQPRDRRLLGVIDEPFNMRSLCTGFGRWRVFLPLEQDSLFYRAGELRGQRFEFRGRAYEWPTAPSFGISRQAEPPGQGA